ncbi:hypothetical protein [Fibrella forsythiae]|uniref:Uncharacterized protein n=1 Tax=Fibrella forsythiae TaxID=2817061 RepID=A0ABS3JRU0_9BACT|nr:hypothetical protein [Fibrella forsythiae]MBO0952719.1 hypothetical protein [Fibrella forsythiae]
MKHAIHFAGFLLVTSYLGTFQSVQAQTERGVSWLSGNAGWQKGNTSLFQNNEDLSTLTISLTQGTFLRDNVLVGADLRLSRVRTLTRQGFNFDAVSDSRQTIFGATPFIRRFWGKNALRGYVGGGLAVSYGRNRLLTTNTQQSVSEQESSQWRLTPEFQAGLFYAIDTHWGLDLSARSGLFPVSFTNLNLGLVVLTDVKGKRSVLTSKQTPAQLLTGNWVFGGTFELGSNQQQSISGSEKITTIQRQVTQQYAISPSIGYIPGKRWVIGVAVPIRQQQLTNQFDRSSTEVQTGTVLTKSIGVEPFAKKYLSKSQFGPYVAGRVGWSDERVSGDGVLQSHAAAYNWRISAGLAYLLGTRFIVEGELAGLGHDWSNDQQTGDAHTNTDVSLSLRPALTMTYVFL